MASEFKLFLEIREFENSISTTIYESRGVRGATTRPSKKSSIPKVKVKKPLGAAPRPGLVAKTIFEKRSTGSILSHRWIKASTKTAMDGKTPKEGATWENVHKQGTQVDSQNPAVIGVRKDNQVITFENPLVKDIYDKHFSHLSFDSLHELGNPLGMNGMLHLTADSTPDKLSMNFEGDPVNNDPDRNNFSFKTSLSQKTNEDGTKELTSINLEHIYLTEAEQGKGIVKNYFNNMVHAADRLGINKVTLKSANSTVGGYAFAKFGFDFANPQTFNKYKNEFKKFMDKKRLKVDKGNFDKIEHSWDIAHVLATDSNGETVNIGKEFMTSFSSSSDPDTGLPNSWDGEMDLRHGSKSRRSMVTYFTPAELIAAKRYDNEPELLFNQADTPEDFGKRLLDDKVRAFDPGVKLYGKGIYKAITNNSSDEELAIQMNGLFDTHKEYVDQLVAVRKGANASQIHSVKKALNARVDEAIENLPTNVKIRYKKELGYKGTPKRHFDRMKIQNAQSYGADLSPSSKSVQDMDGNELSFLVGYSEQTGLKSKKAWDERQVMPHRAHIDIDGFKAINDNAGHEAGDLLLKAIGEAMAKVSKETYHMGGNKFKLQAKTPEELKAHLDKIRAYLKDTKPSRFSIKDPTKLAVTMDSTEFSVGVGTGDEDTDRSLATDMRKRTKQGFRPKTRDGVPKHIHISEEGMQRVYDDGGAFPAPIKDRRASSLPTSSDRRRTKEDRRKKDRGAPSVKKLMNDNASEYKRISQMNIDDMSSQEKQFLLYVSGLTGQWSKRAWNERHPMESTVHSDVDFLATVNKMGGFGAGDAVLRKVGRIMTQHTTEAYHISGDEFNAQGHSPEVMTEMFTSMSKKLKEERVRWVDSDGVGWEMQGIGLSFGVGATSDAAETALKAHKDQRVQSGERPKGKRRPKSIKKIGVISDAATWMRETNDT